MIAAIVVALADVNTRCRAGCAVSTVTGARLCRLTDTAWRGTGATTASTASTATAAWSARNVRWEGLPHSVHFCQATGTGIGDEDGDVLLG